MGAGAVVVDVKGMIDEDGFERQVFRFRGLTYF